MGKRGTDSFFGSLYRKGHLAPFLPGHPLVNPSLLGEGVDGVGPVAGAPWGSACILPISWTLHSADGSWGIEESQSVCHPQCQLHGEAAGALLQNSFPVSLKLWNKGWKG